MSSGDAELTLAHRYYALASNPHDRPVVVRRNTIPTLITLMISAYPAVRRIAAETIYLLCEHPENTEFLVNETNLLHSLNVELDVQLTASQNDCSTSPMEGDPEDEIILETLKNETIAFLQGSRDILDDFVQNRDVLSDDGSSSPQARPAYSASSSARPTMRRLQRGEASADRSGHDESSVSRRRQNNRQNFVDQRSGSHWWKSALVRGQHYACVIVLTSWRWLAFLCLWSMGLAVRSLRRREPKDPLGEAPPSHPQRE